MADPTATYSATVDASDDDITYLTIDGANSADLEELVELLETTDFDDGGVRSRLPGLKDSSISLEYDWELTDAGQVLIRAGYTGRSIVYIKILPDGTNGWKVAMYVESLSTSAAVDGKATVSVTLQGTGAVTVV